MVGAAFDFRTRQSLALSPPARLSSLLNVFFFAPRPCRVRPYTSDRSSGLLCALLLRQRVYCPIHHILVLLVVDELR